MNGRNDGRFLAHLPLAVFGVVYAVTFFLGAVLLLDGPDVFVRLFARTIGIRAFWLEPGEVFANWLLIVVAPVLFAAGWILWSRRTLIQLVEPKSLPLRPLAILYAVLLLGGLASLARAGTLTRIGSWLDYGYFIQSRFLLFSRLSFLEWVNLYAFLPASAGLLVVRLTRVPWGPAKRRLAIAGIVISLLVMELLVFQKRYALLSAVFLAACAVVSAPDAFKSRRRIFLRAVGFGGAVYLVFCALAIISTTRVTPIVVQGDTTELFDALLPPPSSNGSSGGGPVDDATRVRARESGAVTGASPAASPGLARTYYCEIRWPVLRSAVAKVFPGRWVSQRVVHAERKPEPFLIRFLHSVLAPVTRLAPPALAYPALFPRVLGFFGLDVASDMAGFGRMPDDNLVVYGAMYGQLDKGAISVPFQYSWFSQIGLFGALLLCAPIGAATAAAWRASLAKGGSREGRAVLGALVIMFALHITQDSVRGALLNSYGVVWALVLVLGIEASLRARRSPPRSE